ncbi:MAG: ParA family protein [Phototrophicaceae bacterium]
MYVVTMLNEKGGVGKTTLSTHIAAGLAVKGYRVVLVDSDPQGHACSVFGLNPEPGLYNLLVRNASFRDVLRGIPSEIYAPRSMPAKGTLAIIPSNVETRNIAAMISNVFAVKQRMDELANFVDVVIFDTSPTPSLLHGAIYVATDGMLYPTELSALSFQSLVESFSHREAFAKSRIGLGLRDIQTLGIIPTKTRLKTIEHSENLKMLEERYGDLVWEPVALSVTWEEASMQNRTVLNYAPDSSAAQSVWWLVARFERAIAQTVA